MNRRGREAVTIPEKLAADDSVSMWDGSVSKPICGSDAVRAEHQKEPIPYLPTTFIFFLAKLSLKFVFS